MENKDRIEELAEEIEFNWGNQLKRGVVCPSDIAEWHFSKLQSLEQKYQRLLEAVRGLSMGTDWNNGTHAITHGYRRMLVKAVKDLETGGKPNEKSNYR